MKLSCVVLTLAAFALTASPAPAQPKANPAPGPDLSPRPTPKPAPRVPKAAPSAPTPGVEFTLKVTPEHVVTFKGKAVPAEAVVKDLAKQMDIPVKASALVARQKVTLSFDKAPIETFLLALAPQVYIDYEIRWDRPQEDWIGIELTGFNEREPVTPVQPRAFMVFAGSTDDEDVTQETIAADQTAKDEAKLKKDPPKEGPVLDVTAKNGLVSIRARKMMATAILLDVASKSGLGFETRGELDDAIIDLDVRDMPVEQIPAAVGRPGVGLLMRRNLTTGGVRAVAVLLGSKATRIK